MASLGGLLAHLVIAKGAVDQAIGQAYARLAEQSEQLAAFTQLLQVARQQSQLLSNRRSMSDRVEAIWLFRNLAQHCNDFARPAQEWSGSDGSLHLATDSLVKHLFSEREMPRFLSWVWFGGDQTFDETKRSWFLRFARGDRFRSCDLPIALTRRMEHMFLQAEDHFTLESALRNAELRVMGFNTEVVEALLSTRLGSHLEHGEFWRTVFHFLLRYQDSLDKKSVQQLVGYIHHVRFEPVPTATKSGLTSAPAQPDFSLKGRTLDSLMRLVRTWAKEGDSRYARWDAANIEPFFERQTNEDGDEVIWWIQELTTSRELREEGKAMRNCLGSYYDMLCYYECSHIFSLRKRVGSGRSKSIASIEVDHDDRTIIQAYRSANRPLAGTSLDIVNRWAKRENLPIILED